MKKISPRFLKVVSSITIGSILLLYVSRSHPVVFRWASDWDTIRPRYYCVLNPFRDKAPEKIAETYLQKLRGGDVESIQPFLSNSQSYIPNEERKWPIQSWRVGRRIDKGNETRVMYWVTRGNGYSHDGYEEEAEFSLKKSTNGWHLVWYSAIY